MANSRKIISIGQFGSSPRTPGPLGHNDAAAPDAPAWLRGDTPGSLGIQDHGDPNLAAFTTMNAISRGDSSVKCINETSEVNSVTEADADETGAGHELSEDMRRITLNSRWRRTDDVCR